MTKAKQTLRQEADKQKGNKIASIIFSTKLCVKSQVGFVFRPHPTQVNRHPSPSKIKTSPHFAAIHKSLPPKLRTYTKKASKQLFLTKTRYSSTFPELTRITLSTAQRNFSPQITWSAFQQRLNVKLISAFYCSRPAVKVGEPERRCFAFFATTYNEGRDGGVD